MTNNEIRYTVRDTVVNYLVADFRHAYVDADAPYTLYIPVVVEGKTVYARVGITCAKETDETLFSGEKNIVPASEYLPKYRAERNARLAEERAKIMARMEKQIAEAKVLENELAKMREREANV